MPPAGRGWCLYTKELDMSMNVTTGFWCRARSMPALLRDLAKWERRVLDTLSDKQAQLLATKAVGAIDRYFAGLAKGDTPAAPAPYLDAVEYLFRRQDSARVKGVADSETDLTVRLDMWCSPAGNFIGEVLGAERARAHQMLLGARMARNFSVCTSTDKPSGMSQREWQRLTGTWAAIQHGEFGPSFSFTVSAVEMPLSADLARWLPTMESRCCSQAIFEAFEKFKAGDAESGARTVRSFQSHLARDNALRESVAVRVGELQWILPENPAALLISVKAAHGAETL
jgi:hypothetical protein